MPFGQEHDGIPVIAKTLFCDDDAVELEVVWELLRND